MQGSIGPHMTVKNPTPASGRAHIIELHCDLCKDMIEIDSMKLGPVSAEACVERLAGEHVCKKSGTAKEKAEQMRAKEMVPTAPKVEQYEAGSREERLRRDGDKK